MLPRIREYSIHLHLFATALSLLLTGNTYAQKLQFDNYDIRDGLSANVIKYIIQDKKGYMWFASQVGVSRFDGYEFVNYGITEGLPFNMVECIMEDSRGRIWAGSLGGGMAILDKGKWMYIKEDRGLTSNIFFRIFEDRDGNIWCYPDSGITMITNGSVRTFTVKDGLSGNQVNCHWLDDDGKILVGTLNSLDLIRKEHDGIYTIESLLSEITVTCLLRDNHGFLWIGTWDDGVYRYDGKSFVNYTKAEGLPGKPVICFYSDHDGNVWTGLRDGGIARLVNERFILYTDPVLRHATILDMVEDHNHTIWAQSLGEGIFMINSDRVRQISTSNNLSDNYIWKIMTDSDGNIWMGTGGGISKMGKKPFEIYDTDFGVPEKNVLCTFVDKQGNIWGGTYLGPFRISPDDRLTTFDERDGLHPVYLTIFKINADLKDQLWFGTYLGITGYNGDRFVTYRNPKWEKENIEDKVISDMAVDQQNNLILADDDGVCEFHGGRYSYPVIYAALAGKAIQAIELDPDKNLWVCTSEGLYVTGRINLAITSSEGLSNNSCNDIYLDPDGSAWIATDNGLNKIALKADGTYDLTRFMVSDGLLSNTILFVEGDRKGNLWIGHEKGLSRLSPVSGSISTYTDIDGFTPLETFNKAVAVDDYNHVWIGTVAGLVKYVPEYDQPRQLPPRLYLTGVKFYNDSADIRKYSSFTDSLTGLPGNLVLPFNKNNLVFEYVGLHYSNTLKNSYQYILEGYDDKWSEIIAGTATHPYQKIPHGEYVFKVKASNCDGIWSDPVSFSFSIKPPFWKTGWFFALEIIMGMSLIYAFVKIRIRKLQHDKNVLAQKVKERTLEIERQRDHIAEINREITDSILYAQRIQAAVLPDQETIKSLLNDYFILFKPRDIVSGDFYWFSKKGNKIIAVAADCTGHGVPGAFMSMLGVSLLNEILATLDTFTAADILNQLREYIKYTLSQTGKKDEAKDGMDMALCIVDTGNYEAQFAGAYNPLWHITNQEMIIYKGDKMPIGIHIANEYNFTNNVFKVNNGDVLYMFSDGYADQFGGPEYKKFKSGSFRDLVLEIHNKSMNEQREILDKTIEEWKGDTPQIDDIMVMGIRIGEQ